MKGVFLKAGAICSSFPVGSNAESRVAFAALQLPSGTDPSTAGNWWKLDRLAIRRNAAGVMDGRECR